MRAACMHPVRSPSSLTMMCGGCGFRVSESCGFIIADWTDVLCWTCWRADPRRPASREGATTEAPPCPR